MARKEMGISPTGQELFTEILLSLLQRHLVVDLKQRGPESVRRCWNQLPMQITHFTGPFSLSSLAYARFTGVCSFAVVPLTVQIYIQTHGRKWSGSRTGQLCDLHYTKAPTNAHHSNDSESLSYFKSLLVQQL
jgi:hypothetical protein